MCRLLILAANCLAAAGVFAWLALRGGEEPWPEPERMSVIISQSIGSPAIHDEQTRYLLYFRFQSPDLRQRQGASIAKSQVERGQPVIVLFDPAEPARCWASPADAGPALAEYAGMRDAAIESSQEGRLVFGAFGAFFLAATVYFTVRGIIASRAPAAAAP
jgi:hypothetical protein